MLLLRHRGDMEKGVRALVEGRTLDNDTVTFLDSGYDLEAGEFLPRHPPLPIVWEQQRPKRDAKFVESNLTMAALLDCHSNSSTITSTYAGEVADEYEANYMTKEGAGLKYAASMMLTAIEHIARYPSVAPDAGSLQRTGTHLATRTVNAFVGGHEWSLRLMAYALMGFVSFESSDSHWYIYPHDLVSFVAQERSMTGNATHLDDIGDISYLDFERALGDMIAEMDKDDDSGDARGKRKGTRTYKCDGQLVFVTQAESFKHRGPHFVDYSPLEFVAIVDILLPKKPATPSATGAGRPRRCGFPLAPTHPLSPYGFLAYIRVKFLTPMFGGAPPPTLPSTATHTAPRKHHRGDVDNEDGFCDDDNDGDEGCVNVDDLQGTSPGDCKVDAFAKYLLCTFAPWQSTPLGPVFEFNATGLAELCRQWDRHDASLVNRQRYRYLRNVMQRGHRNSHNEETTTLWRSRNADWWKDLPGKGVPCEAPSGKQATSEDNEAQGRLPSDSDVYLLANAAALGNPVSKAYIDVLQTQFANLFSVDDGAPTSVESCAKASAVVYAATHHHSEHDCHSPVVPSLRQLATNLQKMTPQQHDDEEDRHDRPDLSCVTGVHDPLAGPRHCHTALVAPCFLSQEQYEILHHILSEVTQSQQALTMVHAPGGCGKSYVVVKTTDELTTRSFRLVNTCPTGAGAVHMRNGRTFASAFKTHMRGDLSPQLVAEMRLLFTKDVVVVVVDEVSMFSAQNLSLLDQRLRQLYDPSRVFGGISILLVGDFLQLRVIGGVDLYKVMYVARDAVEVHAQDLFRRFRVFEMHTLIRAQGCALHQQRLCAFRSLPDFHPTGARWSVSDLRGYKPMTQQLIGAITTQITAEDIRSDVGWTNTCTIITTSNVDKATISACSALLYGKRLNHIVVRWRRALQKNLPEALQTLVCDESTHPQLFAYFVYGAPAQLLANGNANVDFGAANGTGCLMDSLGWDNVEHRDTAEQLIDDARGRNDAVVTLPFPPEFINVCLLTADGQLRDGRHWPDDNNLATRTVSDEDTCRERIIIPIGLIHDKTDKFCVKLGAGRHTQKVSYRQHAVDLAFAVTVWKSQGATLKNALVLLEGSPDAPKWCFEHLYVAYSRVPSESCFRCFPLSPAFRLHALANLRPNIWAVKWRMDVRGDGYWRPHEQPQHSRKTSALLSSMTTTKRAKVQTIPAQLHKVTASIADDAGEGDMRILCTYHGIDVRVLDFKDAQPGGWFSDTLIDFYAHFLHDTTITAGGVLQNFLVCTSSLYTKWLQTRTFESVRTWMKRDCLAHRFWLVPICEASHWQLLAIVRPSEDTCRLLLFDSMALNPHNADSIEAFAHSMIRGTRNLPHLQWHHPSILNCQVPRQPNGFDCGVYVLKFLQLILNADEAFLLMLETPPGNPLPLLQWFVHSDIQQMRLDVIHQILVRGSSVTDDSWNNKVACLC